MNTTQNEQFLKRYQSLNSAQKTAVDATEGPVLVIAGPGSGKTELLALRIANILKIGSAKAENVLALTFTESAANNMRDRLIGIMGSEAYKVPIFTFHSFCTHLISRYPEHFFNAHRFEPISDLRQNEILSGLFDSLKYGNPLYSGGYHAARGYAYFSDVIERIKNFKEAGLKPGDLRNLILENKKELEILTKTLELVPSRVSKDTIQPFLEALYASKTNLGEIYASSVEALVETDNLGKLKSSILTKKGDGSFSFKEEKYTEKFLALAEIYESYQNKLKELGFFDFNDMIMYVKDMLMNNSDLRAEVEETYQYILVDEFQDTNNAQLELIKSMTSNPVLEGRANIFVVGDDDQSIYKFQGAELSNIFNFKKSYVDVQTVVLTDNYRSTQKVLDFASKIISQAQERLVKKNPELVKDMIARNTNLEIGEVFLNSFKAKEQEQLFVADKIANILSGGVPADEIAVITRKHSQLQSLLPYLDTANVPYNYERKESVFDQKHIEELITICAFLESVSSSHKKEDDELLSRILSFDFLGIDRLDIWSISKESYGSKKTWLEIMLEHKDNNIKNLAQFFVELGVLSKSVPLEIILDIIIGSRDVNIANSEHEDDYYHNSIPKIKSPYVSRYKEVYFGKEVLEGDIASYVHFLSSLRVFIFSLREYKKGEKLYVSDLSTFVALHKEYNIALLNKTAFTGNTKAVNLMTAHKAKGLEFQYVFILGAEDSAWTKQGRINKLPLPKNMPYGRAADSSDDFLRLLFVALTRSKHTLYITHTDRVLSFIANLEANIKTQEVVVKDDQLLSGLSVYNIPPFAQDEKALLLKMLEGYKLSPTHLTNFLNIPKGGPRLFLEQNLLRFPQSKSSSSIYGSAIHKAIEMLYVQTKKDNELPGLQTVLDIFEREVKKDRLLPNDEINILLKGKDKIEHFYNSQKENIIIEARNSRTEVDMSKQNIQIDGAHVTGKIDRLFETQDTYEVIDIKSGKSFSNFEYTKSKTEDYENIKKHSYKYQLLMYKILIENSRDYSKKSATKGVLSFVDTDEVEELELDFTQIPNDEIIRFKKLLVAVYKKITSLDFPEVSKYTPDIQGILDFEKDLIEEKI